MYDSQPRGPAYYVRINKLPLLCLWHDVRITSLRETEWLMMILSNKLSPVKT